MIFALVQDFADTLDVLPIEQPRRRTLALLAEALRREVHFLDRHPTTLFQCMWNTCWWYDCPERAKHCEPPKGGWPSSGLPWQAAEPMRLSTLLNEWRGVQAVVGSRWLRSACPPWDPLGSSLKVVIRGHKITCAA